MATEADVKDPISASLNEVEHKEIISDFSNTIINKIVTEEREKVESGTIQPSETVTIFPMKEESQVTNDVEKEKVEIDDEGHTGSTVGEPFLQPPPVVTGLLKKDEGEIQWSMEQGANSLQEENEGKSNDVIVSVGDGKIEPCQEENSTEGKILVQGHEPTGEILEGSKAGAAEQIQEFIESPYAEINTNTKKEELADHVNEAIDEASRINIKITDEQNRLPSANMDEKASTKINYSPNEEELQLEGIDHDKVPPRGQADEIFEVHQDEKHVQGNNEADKGPDGTEKIEITPSAKAPMYEFNEDPEQQEKASNSETETTTDGIERYQTNIDAETNAIKEPYPSIVLEEEEERSFKIPISTEKEVREPNIECTGHASDKEFTGVETSNYESLSSWKDQAELKEREIALEFNDQSVVDTIKEFEKIEYPQSQDFGRVVDVQTLDVKTCLPHETGLLHVDPNFGDDDTSNKTVKDHIADLEVATAIESPLVLEEIKKETLEKPVKDKVHREESEITTDDQVHEKSLEDFPGQTAPGAADEVKEIEEISEPQCQDFKSIAAVETWQDENSGQGNILVQGNEPTGEILEGSKARAAELIQEIIGSPYAEINTNTEKEESVDHVKEVIDEASRINIKITDEQNSLPTANMDEKASTELNYSPNEEELQLEGINHDKVPSKGQADETFEVHQEEKHVQGTNEADKGPEGTEKIEITPSEKAPVDEFNEDPEQQEKAPNTETETATDGIERYQLNIEVETNAIKELDPSIFLKEEEEEERSFKIPITTEKEVRESNIECPGQASDKEFTGLETSNYETLSEGFNKQSHLVTSEGKIVSQEKNIDDGKASSDPEVSKDEIEQPTASKDEKALDILEEDKELSNDAPERDKTGNNMLVKDDQLQFEGGSLTVADNEEAVSEKHVLASSSSKEDIQIEKRVELDVESQDHVSEAELDSSNTVTEKVLSYSEGLSIPLEQNSESLEKSKELKLVAGSLSNDGEINITEQKNLEESYNNQTGSREEQTTVKDNKGDEIDTKDDILSSSVGQEELGKVEEKTLTEEVAERNGEIDENELLTEKTQKEASTEDLHVMPEVNETLQQTTVPDSTTLHDHGAIYFDSGLSEDKITADLALHAEELSMSTEFEKGSVEAVEKPEDFTTRTSDESQEKIKDEKEKQEINDDAPTVIIENTFVAEAQFDHYSVKEADEISCEKHESETTIEIKEGKTTNNDIAEFGNIKLAENERASGFDDQVPERSLEALPDQSAQEIDEVEEIEIPKCQDFERIPNVETPLAHETRLLQIDEDPKDRDDQSANKLLNTDDYEEDLEVVPSTESPLVIEESKNPIFEQLVKDKAELKESEIALEFNDQVHGRSFEASQRQSVVDKIKEFEKIEDPQSQDFERVVYVEILDVKSSLPHDTGILHVDPNDGDDDTSNNVADLEVAPAIESPLVLEEIKKATLEKPVKEEVHREESEITTDDQVQEKSLEVLPGQTTSGAADEVKEIEKLSEPQCQDFKSVAAFETLDIQTPSAHETGLLKVEENFKNGANDTADKGTNIEDHVADLEVVHAIEPPLILEEIKEDEKENPENSIKDDVEKEENETGDRVLDRSLEDFPCTSAQDAGVDEIEEIEKISEPQSRDFERIGDVQTSIAHESESLHEDPKDGDDDTADKVGNAEDSVADLEVVPAIESPLALEESKNATLPNLYKDQAEQKEGEIALESYDQVHEGSLEALTHQSPKRVDEVEEIEKISEPQFQDLEIVADLETLDVKTPLAHETGLLHADHNDGDDDTNSKTVKDYLADLKVDPIIEESKKETLEKPMKDKVHLEEITTGSDDQVSEKSLEAIPGQTTPGVDEVEEIKKISEPQFQDLEIVADDETLDVQIPPAHETGLLHIDPNDEDDDTANKTVKDYAVDLKVASAAESPLVLEKSEKETLEKSVKDEVHLEESEIITGSKDQVPEKSLETCPSQTRPGVDEVEEIEKIAERQCQDFEKVADIGTHDVQTPPAHDTGLLKVDENLNGANDTADKGTNIEDYVEDLELVHAIDSPLALEESKEIEKENLEKSVKETVEKENNEMEDQVLERSLEDLQCKREQESGVNDVKEIEKISEPQSQDFERIDDFQTPIAYETELVHVDSKDGDDDTANKVGNPEDYVAEPLVVPSIDSPLAIEESKNTTLEKIYKDQAELKEGELALESDDQGQVRSLEALTPQSAQGVDEVEEIDKISEPRVQDLEVVADVETLDVKTPLAHETGLLHVNPNDGDDDTDSKTAKDYVEDLKVAPATESPFVLEECKKETLGKPVKDEVHLEESEITTGSDDQVPETSNEAFPGQKTPGTDEAEEIEKIAGPQCQDFQRVDDVETLDVQTPPAHEPGLLKVDENLNGANDTDDKGKNIEDYVSDLEVVHAIESPLVLEEGREIEKEKNEKDDRVLERSLEEFPCKSAQDAGVDKVNEIEKISEPQSQDFERIDDVQTSIAYESEQVHMDPKDGSDDTANKVGNAEDYVAEPLVVPSIDSPLAIEESKNTTLEKIYKDQAELKEGELALESDDQGQVRSLEALTPQSAQGVDEVEEIDKISEPRVQDLEVVADVETLDVKTPLAHETGLLHVNPNDGDDDTDSKTAKDYVADLKVAPATESPFVLEECKKETLGKPVKDEVHLEESEITTGSDDQVPETSNEAFPGQKTPGTDEAEEIEKIAGPQCQDFQRVDDVETLDVQTPPAHEPGLLKVDENLNGANDTDDKGKNIEDYVSDLEVVHAIESPLVLEEGREIEKEKNEKDDRVLERSLEEFPCKSAQDAGVDKVNEIEKISEPQSQDFERIDDVQTSIAYESEQVDPKDGSDDTANKVGNAEDYVADLVVVPAIESPLELEESKNTTLEKLYKDQAELKEGELALELVNQVQERAVEALTHQSERGVDEVEQIEKISEPQFQDLEKVADVQTPFAHETGLLHVDPNDGDDDTVNKTVEDYVVEPQSQDFERVVDVQTPIAHESELLHMDPKDGDDDTADNVGNTEDSVADLEVVPTIESPLALEESKNATLPKLYKDQAEHKECEIAHESYEQFHERSLEALTHQSAQGVDEVAKIEKISEPQFQDLEIVDDLETLDVKTPLAHETGLLHVDPNDGEDDTNTKTVKDYVADLKVAPPTESPLVFEESKKETLEKPVKDEVHMEEITTGSDDQDSEKLLEAFPGQTTPGVDEVEEIEQISEDLETIADDETLDVQIPPAHETGLLHVDPNDEYDDTTDKTVKDYVVDLKVAPAAKSPLVLEESKKGTLEKLVKDEVHLEESEITTGSDDQVPDKSLETCPIQTTPGVDEVEEIEKISEPQCQDFERVADVETHDVQTPPAHDTGLVKVDENVIGANDTADKGTNIEDYITNLEVVHAIESPVALEESKETEKENPEKSVKEKNEMEDRLLESSLKDLQCESAQESEVDEIKEIEKISEPKSQDFERIGDVQSTIAHESELLPMDPKDGDDDTADKVRNTEDSVADLKVVPAIESPLALEESKNATLLKLYKDQAEHKECEIAIESYDQVHERSLGDFTYQSAEGVHEVEEIEKISEPQFHDLEIVAALETLDVKTPLAHETGLLHGDPNDGDDDTNSKTVKDYVADLEVAPATESPLVLEESKQETLEKPVKDEVHQEEVEIINGSKDQVQERSLETFSGQTAPEVDEVEKISESHHQDFERIANVETLDVQKPPAHQIGLLNVDENSKNGANDTALKGTNIEDYVADLEVVHAIESPLTIAESKNVEKENPENSVKNNVEQEESETNNLVPERSLDVDPKDGDDNTANKVENSEDYGEDLEVVPTIESPLAQEVKMSTNLEKNPEDEDDMKESEIAPGFDVQVQGRSLEALPRESAQAVDKVEENEKISELQCQDFERVVDAETFDVHISPAHERVLIQIDEDPKDGDTDTTNKGMNSTTIEDKETNEDASIINLGTSPQYETGLQGNVVSQEEENETATISAKIEIQDGEKKGSVREGVDEETSKDLEMKFQTQFQGVERVTMSEDSSIINIGTSPHYETGLQGNEVSQAEENETATTIEKIEIQDGVKEAFQGICEQGTVTEGGDGKTSGDVEKTVESQDVERVATSEDDSIVNVGTSTQYETGLQGKEVSQEEEPETITTLEKIDIQDGEKEVFQGICEKGTVTKDGYGESNKDVEKKFETQFQDVERVISSEDASIIDVGTSPQYETGLQVNVVSQEEENETEKVEIQNGEKEAFPGICEQRTVTEGGDEETSEDMEKKFESQFQDVERVATCEDATIINVGISQNEPGLLGNVMSQEKINETTPVTEKTEIQEEGEKEDFDGIVETAIVTGGGNGETFEDVKKKFETQFQDVERVATSDYVSTINVGTSPEHETGLGMNVVSPKEENETETITKKIEIQDGEKESCERNKDVSTNQDTKEPISVEAKSVSGTYYDELVNPMEEIEREKDMKSTSVKVDQQTGDAETEFSIKPIEVLTKESKDVCTNQDSKVLATIEDKVVTETYHKERGLVNPMEENVRDKDVKSALLVTEDLRTGDDDTVVSIKPREVLTKESFEQSKDVCTNQDTKELVNVEDNVVTETYHEGRTLVNHMEENKRDKDVKSASVTLDLQTEDNSTEVIIKPTEILTKEEPVELSIMGSEGKLKETNTDSNIPIDNDGENKDQIEKSIDSPHAKHSSPDLVNEEINVDEEYEEDTERFTMLKPTKLSLSDLMQKSIRKAPQVADESIPKKELIHDNQEEKNEGTEIKHGEESKTEEENDEGDEHKGQDSGSDAPVMVEASRDIDTKHTHKKSHNILSGVGSKVKHSIAKVKKVITGKTSPHSKPPSPRIDK